MNVLNCECFDFKKYPPSIVLQGIDWTIIKDIEYTDDKKHYLVLSKQCKASYLDLPYYNSIELFQLLKQLISSENLIDHTLSVNNGGRQHIPHVHYHIQ